MIEFLKRLSVKEDLASVDKLSDDCWVRVIDPTEEEVNYLVDEFQLNKESVMDGLDANEVPRFEMEDGNFYIFLRLPRYHGEAATSSFLLILTKTCFVTVNKDKLGMFEKFSAQNSFLTNNNMKATLQFLSYISRSFGQNVNKILKEVKKDRNKLSKLNTKDILDLVKQEDILNDYVFSFSPLIDMYSRIIKCKPLNFGEEEKEFVEDLVIDMNQTYNSCQSALKIITNMRDYYSTSLSHNLNRILEVLTLFTIFLTIPTVISSIYGMNIHLPFQNSPHLFLYFVLFTSFVWVFVFFVFRKFSLI